MQEAGCNTETMQTPADSGAWVARLRAVSGDVGNKATGMTQAFGQKTSVQNNSCITLSCIIVSCAVLDLINSNNLPAGRKKTCEREEWFQK